MKALTLQQPWATLIANGSKKVETRSWHPKENPGTLVICSSKKPASVNGCRHVREGRFGHCLDSERGLPRSAMLAVVTVRGFARTDDADELTNQERTFGDYRPGRWAWFLEDVIRLPEPVLLSAPPRGKPSQFRLGIWELLPKDEKALRRALPNL